MLLEPTHHKRSLELAFYHEYFGVANCFGDLNRIFEIGEPEALKFGITVIDTLHLAAANLAKCSLFVTTEKHRKPIFRTKLVKVASISEMDSTGPSQIVRKLLAT